MNKTELVEFNHDETALNVIVSPSDETIWLSLNQITELFERDKSTISRHINNVFKDGELDRSSVVAKNATTASDGKTYDVDYYNLDVIISVGYRVKSRRATAFRKWATSVLRDYLIKGYVVDKAKVSIENYNSVLSIMSRASNDLQVKEVVDILSKYATGLQLLDDYDHQELKMLGGMSSTYALGYDECIEFVNKMKREHESDVFGVERDHAFKSSIGAIYQTFGGEDVYPTIQEKAANLLYFLVKNHGFIDGNKRIAAALFVQFLNLNEALFNKEGQYAISNETLAVLTIMLAESNPNEKDVMIKLIVNLIN